MSSGITQRTRWRAVPSDWPTFWSPADAMFDLRESLYPSQSDDPYPDDRFLPLVDILPNN